MIFSFTFLLLFASIQLFDLFTYNNLDFSLFFVTDKHPLDLYWNNAEKEETMARKKLKEHQITQNWLRYILNNFKVTDELNSMFRM